MDEGWMDRRKDGWTDGQMDGRRLEKAETMTHTLDRSRAKYPLVSGRG